METCFICHHEPAAGTSCSCEYLIDGEFIGYHRIPNGDDPCDECRCRAGGMHHRHCTSEICPKCGGLLMECGCRLTYYTALIHPKNRFKPV